MSLTSKSPSETYKDIIYVDNFNNGVDDTARTLKSGSGAATLARIGRSGITLRPATDSTSTFTVVDSGGNSKLAVDTDNDTVKALGVHVNTQYAYFGISGDIGANFASNTHQPLPFVGNNQSVANQENFSLGTGTDPATTFTTADGSLTDASLVVPCLLYLPDAISIDAVTSIEGATGATGDTTRCHLMSYTFTSGSTSCLTSGTLLAHNTDVTNAGSEQAYKSDWTVDSAAVTAGKVILATFRSDTANSDYSVSVIVKYHLTG